MKKQRTDSLQKDPLVKLQLLLHLKVLLRPEKIKLGVGEGAACVRACACVYALGVGEGERVGERVRG